MKKLLHILSVAYFLGVISTIGMSQNNALVINGDYIVMSGGTVANNNYLVVDQPNTAGIIRVGGGYIISENQYNYVKWNAGINTGSYVFPFGIGAVPTNYIPFTFNKTTAGNANVFTSTWETNQQNMPHAALSDVGAVTSMNCTSMNSLGDSVTAVIDRFWDIQTTSAATGDLTFSYLGSENTTANPTGTFDAEHWNGASWDVPVGPGNAGLTAGVGIVGPVIGQTTFSPWALVSLPTTFTATGNATICGGNNTPLSASGASSYTWMPAASLSNPNAANPTASPTTTTIYTVTSTNANGCVNSTAITVTITVNPSPTYSLASNVYTICNGTSQTFSVSGAITWTWTPTATLTNPNTATPTASPTTTTVYSVTGTGNNGCTNPIPATVTVNVTPPPTLSIAGGNNYTICNGSSQTLTVNPALATYTWSPAGSLNNAAIQNPTATPTATTVYTVSGTASGCAASAPITVTVNVNPLPTYSLTSNTYTICNGASQGLSVSGANTYTWTPNATLTNANTATPTATPTTTMVYSVVGTSTAGCVNPTAATVTVTVNPLPTYTILPSTLLTICNGGSATFTVSGATTYTWATSAPGTLTGTNTANPTANPTTTTVYSVTGTDNVGCTNPAAETVTVSVTAAPTLSLSASSYTICNGSSQTFTVSGASTYTWTNPATLIGANTANPTANPTTTTVYTVSGTASGCAPSPSQTVALMVSALPTYSLLPTNTFTICNGTSQTLSVNGATTYTWSTAQTGSSITVTPSVTSVYSVTGTDANGCTNPAAATATVNVNPLPIYSILPSSSFSICSGGSATFSVSGASSYTWTPVGTLTNPNSANPTANPTTTTIYSVTGTDVNGCSNLNSATVTVSVTLPPTLSLVGGNTYTMCNGSFQVLSVNPSSLPSYIWSPGGATTSSISVNPTATTIYTVSGTASGCAASTAITATVNVNATPIISIASVSSNTICSGNTSVITPAGAATYTLNPGNITGTSFTISPTTNTTYTIDGTNSATGCMNAAADEGITTIIVNTTPTISIASVSSNTICSGASSVITPTGAATYTLNPGNIMGTSFTVNPTTNTIYTIDGTNAAGACINTPANAGIVNITVNTTPTISIASVSSNTICSGVSSVITPAGAATYTLNPGNQIGTSFTVSPTTSTTYTIDGTNIAGCANTAADESIVNITVNPTPTIGIAAVSNGTICSGNISVIIPTGANTYTLNPSNQIGTSFTVSPTINTTYTINGTNASGCINAPADTALVSITVNTTPTVGIVSVSSSTLCSGNSSVIIPSGASSYTLNPGNQTGTSFTVSPIANITYTITGSNGAGCVSSNMDIVPITVNPTPTVNLNGASFDTVKCNQPGGVVNINASNVGGGTAPYTYQWTNVNTGSTYTSNTTPSFTNQPAGTYSLLVTDVHGCTATNTGTVSTTQVVPSLSVTASFTTSAVTGNAPLAVSFTNTSNNAITYTWTLGNGTTSNLYNPPATTYSNVGTYTVMLIAMNGACISKHSVIVTVDVPTNLIIPNIFSPNGDGVNDQFFIISTGINSLTCDIFNRWGELLYTMNAPNQVWDGRAPNGGNAPDGTYFYILQAQGVDGKTYKQNGPLTLIR